MIELTYNHDKDDIMKCAKAIIDNGLVLGIFLSSPDFLIELPGTCNQY